MVFVHGVKEKKMRLIDADNLIDRAHREKLDSRELIVRMIESEPIVDVVEVVRCKDCKFYRKTAATAIDYFDYIKGNTKNKKPLYMCDNDVIDWATPEDYCSYGEKKENE